MIHRTGRSRAFAASLLLSLLLLRDTWLHPTTTLPGLFGDPEQTSWFLGWTPWALTHGTNPFFTHHLVQPGGANLAWNTSMFLAGVVLAVPQMLLGVVFATVLLTTLAFALSGYSCYLLLRRLVRRDAAALGAALLFEVSPYMAGQGLGHASLTLVAYVPLVLLVLDSLLRGARSPLRSGLHAGALTGLQLLLNEEVVAATLVAVIVLLGVLGAQHRAALRTSLSRLAVAGGVAAAVAGVVAAPLLAEQFLGPLQLTAPVQPPGYYVADLANLVTPTQVEAINAGAGPTEAFGGGIGEATAYLGPPLLVLLFVAWRRTDRPPLVSTAAITGGLLLVLAMGPSLHIDGRNTRVPLPWRAMGDVPLLQSMLPVRLTLFVDLAAVYLVAVLLDQSRRVPRGLLALLALSWLPVQPYPSHAAAPVPWFSVGAPGIRGGAIVLVAPFTYHSFSTQAMLWQAQAGMRFTMPEGYVLLPSPERTLSGPPFTPVTQRLVAVQEGVDSGSISAADAATYRAELLRDGVSAVVLGPSDHPAALRTFLTAVVGCPPLGTQGVELWATVQHGGC